MILTFPYHSQYPADYDSLVKTLNSKAGNQNHSVLIMCRPCDEEKAHEIALELSKTFGRFFTGVLSQDGDNPLVVSNAFFLKSLRFLNVYKREQYEPEKLPLLYLDPQWQPRKARWLDTLQSEYYLKNAPLVMGGTGATLFSPEFSKKSTLLDFIPNDVHWREYMAGELAANSVSTESIGAHADSLIKKK